MQHQSQTGAKNAEIVFRGRSQADAKRKALNFWYTNQKMLGLSIRDFSGRLTLQPDQRTIVFKR